MIYISITSYFRPIEIIIYDDAENTTSEPHGPRALQIATAQRKEMT